MLPHLGPCLCYFMNKEIELEKGNSWFKSTRLGIGREGIKNQGSGSKISFLCIMLLPILRIRGPKF